jgi:hypothetical protein
MLLQKLFRNQQFNKESVFAFSTCKLTEFSASAPDEAICFRADFCPGCFSATDSLTGEADTGGSSLTALDFFPEFFFFKRVSSDAFN